MSNQPLTIAQAAAAVSESIRAGEHLEESNYPDPEGNKLNGRTADLVRAYRAEHGAAWLGRANVEAGQTIMWEWDGVSDPFPAAFVLPAYDAELEGLIIDRRDAPYTGTLEDSKRVDDIFDRIEELGGRGLLWN